jgi:predicted small lipoprotein YifL
MKKLNLLLIPVLFSSLLIGCGMKGPLYRAPVTPTVVVEKEQPTTPEEAVEEQVIETENSVSQ